MLGADRSTAAMAVATAVSRATGFARTLALAWALGATALGDAYNVANTAPNMIFQLAAGGILSSAIVPLLARARTDDERHTTASALYGLVVVVGVVASVAVALGAPVVVRLLTAGAGDRADYREMADTAGVWLRWFAPQVLAYAVGVYAVAVMTFHGRLVLGAAASIATNVVTIAGAITFVTIQGGTRPGVAVVDSGAVAALGAATTAGVAAMALLQGWGAHRAERRLRPRLTLRHPAVRRVMTLAPWLALYVVVNQVGLAVVTALASSVEGGVSAYQWAFTVMQLPHAVIAVSLISAAFPRIADDVAAGRDPSDHAVRTVRTMTRLLVPAATVLAAVAPVLGVALVGPDGSDLVAAGIAGFAVSLVPFSFFQLATRMSYAYQDTKTPALVNVAVNAANLIVDVAIVAATAPGSARVAGLALGHAGSYVVGAVLLTQLLRRRRGVRFGIGRGARLVVLSALGGAAAARLIVIAFDASTQLAAAGVATAAGVVAAATSAAMIGVTRRRHHPY